MPKKFLLACLMFLVISWVPLNFETRSVGVVSEFNLVSMDSDLNIICYVKAGTRDYFIQNKNTIPYIYVGDSLIEYWVNYQKLYVGSKKNNGRYKIIYRDRPLNF